MRGGGVMVTQRTRASQRVDDLLVLGAQLAERGVRGKWGERGAMLLFNPNHDPHSGEFSSGGGADGSGAGEGKSAGRSGRSGTGSGGGGGAKGAKGEGAPKAAKASGGGARSSGSRASSGAKSEHGTAAERQRAHEAEAARHDEAARTAFRNRDIAYVNGQREESDRLHAEAQTHLQAAKAERAAAQREATVARSQDARGRQLPETKPGAEHTQPLVNAQDAHEQEYLKAEFPQIFRNDNGEVRGTQQLNIDAPDARLIAHAYGEHQTGAILSRFSTKDLRASAQEAGLETNGSKAELVSRLTSHATEGRYKAEFGSKTSSGAKPSKATAKAEKPATEDIHAKSARMQREQGLPAEVKPGGELKPVTDMSGRDFDPLAPVNPHLLSTLYGEHQLGAALSRYDKSRLGEAAAAAHVTTGRTNGETVSRITAAVTGGRYSANFSAKASGKRSAAEAHAAKAARLKAAVDKAQAAYDAHMANAPKLSETAARATWRVEGRRLLGEMRRAAAALRLADGEKTARRFPEALQRVQRFDETGADGFHRSWIMLFPVGHYQHEQYGELDFTPAKLRKIKALYDQRVRHIDAALDVDHRAAHDDSRATGWIESLELREQQPDGTPAGLWGCIKWTPYGMQFLKSDEYRYFSPEFGPWTDPQSGEEYIDVLIGGALTNRPFLKTMPAIALAEAVRRHPRGVRQPVARASEPDRLLLLGARLAEEDGANAPPISRKPWGAIDKDCLPASCFLIVGNPAKKSTWRLPVYEGAGPKDANGVYTRRGALNLNGVKAAWAAVQGAHTGQPMAGVPQGVVARLKRWRARYFPGATGATGVTKQARERARSADGSEPGAAQTGRTRLNAEAMLWMEGRVGSRMFDADLDDDEQFEADEADETRALADGKPAKGSAAMKAKMAALRAKSGRGKKSTASADAGADGDDDAEEMAEDDDAEEMDDGEDESETYDEADGDGEDEEFDDSDQTEDDADDDVDPEDDDGPEDEDESDEPPASARRAPAKGRAKSKKMMGAKSAVRASESRHGQRQGGRMKTAGAAMVDGLEHPMTLAEQQHLLQENARMRYQLYEAANEKILAEWSKGAFQFKENAKGAAKTGRIVLSRSFKEAYRAFMRTHGVRLSEETRHDFLALLEIGLSSAVVDLSERGSSYDGEGRMVSAASRRAAGDDDKLEQEAQRIALAEHGKDIAALAGEPAKVLAIYERASRVVRY